MQNDSIRRGNDLGAGNFENSDSRRRRHRRSRRRHDDTQSVADAEGRGRDGSPAHGNDGTSSRGSRSDRRDSSRRGHDGSRHSEGRGLGAELRAWANVVDGVLVAIEETAWSARRLAEAVDGAVGQGVRDLNGRRSDARELSSDMARFAETGFMVARMAAGYRLHRFSSAFVSRSKSRRMLDRLHEENARRFYEVSARHGGGFLKVGQLLSARADLLPRVWIQELEGLQDAAPAVPFEAIRAVVESDFGKPLEELFDAFEETPVAAASIGQVHRAVTKEGRTVAVKVQRPGVGRRVAADLKLLESFVASLARSLPLGDYGTIVGQIQKAVMAELDYVREAGTAGALADFFAGHPSIHVPRPIDALCSEHVLVTEFVEGEKITVALDRLTEKAAQGDGAAHVELSRVLGLLLEAYLRQVLEAGVFQADPHPGNILVGKDGRLVLLDFGCAELLPDAMRNGYASLLRSFVAGDRTGMGQLFGELGFATESGRTDTLEEFAAAFLSEIRQLALARNVQWPTREELSERFAGLLTACQEDPVTTIPGEFVMLARVFGTLGGLFQAYRPDINFARHVLPVLGLLFVPQGE